MTKLTVRTARLAGKGDFVPETSRPIGDPFGLPFNLDDSRGRPLGSVAIVFSLVRCKEQCHSAIARRDDNP